MFLNGRELAGFIKERQAQVARRLHGQLGRKPKLVILQAKDDPAINTYVQLKQRYGDDVGVEVDIIGCDQNHLVDKIKHYNNDKLIDGIIIQLPIPDDTQLDQILAVVAPNKDVDGLGPKSEFDSATANAILWLLAGYNIELFGKRIVIVGHGRLVGAPLAKMLKGSELNVTVCDSSTKDLADVVKQAEVVITATGSPRLIKSSWIREGAVVVDAGTASEHGEVVGDLADDVHLREDLKLTPQKGGVGPLTVCALFDNVLRAASAHTLQGRTLQKQIRNEKS